MPERLPGEHGAEDAHHGPHDAEAAERLCHRSAWTIIRLGTAGKNRSIVALVIMPQPAIVTRTGQSQAHALCPSPMTKPVGTGSGRGLTFASSSRDAGG